MFGERDYTYEMHRFYSRGLNLADQGSFAVGVGLKTHQLLNTAFFYEEYAIVVGGQEFKLINERTNGSFDYEGILWNPRHQITVLFTPDSKSGLKFVQEGDQSSLPAFRVYAERGKYTGVLEYDREHVQRSNWLGRVEDRMSSSDHDVRMSHFVGSSIVAGPVLRTLNQRMQGDVESVIPVNPSEWIEKANQRAGFGAAVLPKAWVVS
jgi:hypothetical protein